MLAPVKYITDFYTAIGYPAKFRVVLEKIIIVRIHLATNDFIPVGIVLIWLQAWLRSKIACVPQILSCLGHTKFSESANPRAEAVRMPEWVPMYRYLVPNARYRCQLTASIEYTQVQKFA